MKRIFVLGCLSLVYATNVAAQALPTPKIPAQMPATNAQQLINTYKTNTANFFAYGYLLDINKVKNMSPTAVRVYNGLTSDTVQQMAIVPLSTTFKVITGSQCQMLSGNHLCPKICDVAGVEEGMQVSGSQVGSSVNTCMECHMYEPVNALIVFTSTLNALAAQGYSYVRIYNGQDAGNKRYVVYVPVDAQGREVATTTLFVGDNTNTIANCKYP